MNESTIREQALSTYGAILIRNGYEWVDLDDVAKVSAVEIAQLSSVFANKALLCEAWMEETDNRAREHHTALLKSGKASRDIIQSYFDELEKFMLEHNFGGCPFTNTAIALRHEREGWITQRVKEHKDEIRRFFRLVCEESSTKPTIVAESIFLIYSGATTESANIRNIEPVKRGREVALSLFEMYAI